MKTLSILLASVVAACLPPLSARTAAQLGGGPPHARITLAAPAAATAGKAFELAVTVEVLPGYHIQAHTVKPPGYATKLRVVVGPGLKAGEPRFPKPTRATMGGETVEVFAGKVTIEVPVKVAANASGLRKLRATLDCQACNDTSCFPPEQVTKEITVKIRGRAK
jgi:DsbC/DsbD-like thiol-disulfide interchange protein